MYIWTFVCAFILFLGIDGDIQLRDDGAYGPHGGPLGVQQLVECLACHATPNRTLVVIWSIRIKVQYVYSVLRLFNSMKVKCPDLWASTSVSETQSLIRSLKRTPVVGLNDDVIKDYVMVSSNERVI
ncbi:hypothetical protein BDV10DRAFT_99354 [Aspergillus recurvatus]